MRIFCAAGGTFLLSLWLGCSAPENTTLRIGITESAGATMIYLAEELDLYQKHDVHARVVELIDFEALEHAFKEKQVDAVVLPRSRAASLINNRRSDAGVLLVLAIASASEDIEHWQTAEEELLIVRRSEVMHRRSEWSRLLAAYEYARLELAPLPDSIANCLALREHRNAAELRSEIALWSFFGLPEQDSLLEVREALIGLDARWQGNLEFAGNDANKRRNRSIAVNEPDQHHSR